MSAGAPRLAAVDALSTQGGDARGLVRHQLRSEPRAFLAELREHRPILVVPGLGVITRFRDVEEALLRARVFSVKAYAPRFKGVLGPFILSLDQTPAYDHDKAAMRLAMRREDLGRARAIAASFAADAVRAAASPGRPFDIVQSLTRRTPVRLAADYFGVSAPDDATMLAWARALAWEAFENVENDPEARGRAIGAAAAMSSRVREKIAARRAGADSPDDLLGRLLAQQAAGPGFGFDDDGVVRTLMGLVASMVESTSAAAVDAVLALAADPAAWSGAVAAAEADADDLLWAHLQEALRFASAGRTLTRVLNRDYLLGAGEAHETVLPKDLQVLVCTGSAMFDERIIQEPEAFRTDRPPEAYLHFSAGPHACLGRYLSQVQLTQMLKPLLRLKGLRLAAGPVHAGPFPDRLEVVSEA